jgi:tetratricopeptide repeat protein
MKYTQITFQLIGKLFLFIALAGCQQNDKYTALLLQADSIMNVRPDSALALLNSIQFPQEMKTADRALYSLLFTQAEQKNRILHTNDSLIRIAVDYYKDKDDKEQETKAYYYLGCVYQDIGDIVGATDAFLKALNINPQVINDTEILTMIYENLAECYQSQGFYDKAMEMYRASYKINT